MCLSVCKFFDYWHTIIIWPSLRLFYKRLCVNMPIISVCLCPLIYVNSQIITSYRYPAGFVYVYLVLYYITSHGVNIRLAQYIFAALYMISLLVIFDIYRRAKKVGHIPNKQSVTLVLKNFWNIYICICTMYVHPLSKRQNFVLYTFHCSIFT